MVEKKYVLMALFATSFALTAIAQDQAGFISIDCGLQSNISSYNEKSTGIKYISDERFVESGERNIIAEKYKDTIQQQQWSLRSFPEGDRNCYNIDVSQGTKYLIRASFFYGDYVDVGMFPGFDLYLGPNLWDSVKILEPSSSVVKEIIHVAQEKLVQICLVNAGRGVPFISSIELRPLDNSAYVQARIESLALYSRRDTGSNTSSRYGPDKDSHDRFWYPMQYDVWENVNTSETVESQDPNDHYNVPSLVMSTAAVPKDPKASLNIWWQASDNATRTSRFYFFMHFAEIQMLNANDSREFNIFYNGMLFDGPFSPSYLKTTTVSTPNFISSSVHNFSLSRTQDSTLPPIINAYEIYTAIELPQSESDPRDVDAITKLKMSHGLRRNWQGDPCAPKDYSWQGLTCSYQGYEPPRIVSLNLSGDELTGEIPPSIANLTMLEDLNLSNNNLTGAVPEFLSLLPKLKTLNLENNHLSGSIPIELINKRNQGLLSLSVNGNPDLCSSISCNEKKKSVLPVMAISVAGGFALLLTVALTWWFLRRKAKNCVAKAKAKPTPFEDSRNKKFAYSDIIKITNNFERVLGKGGSGIVYYGRIGDNQVAVKDLSSGVDGYQQFQAEVDILLRVYHRNLTTLVGYFNDENHAGLVYEFMSSGDLQSHLSDNNSATSNLKWAVRLRIAVDAAQGLEYLHQGCKPPIIHRDVKSANILLNENFQAKLSDFGISKTFPADSKASYVSTVVAGTPGYLDPEYFNSNRLNEKSDVYSFGILLLEIITGRPAVLKSERISRLSEWVNLKLEKGLINGIIDPRLQGNFNINSAWKVVEIAMNCVSSASTSRPTMSQVVGELKACLETSQVTEANERYLRDPSGINPSNFIADEMDVRPLAR